MPEPCPLCAPTRGVISESACWRLILNENQSTLGRVYFALRRHETDVTALTPDEVASLWVFAARTRQALSMLFAPDHYNYLFHMNLTPHTHMHIYPRYAAPREFGGQAFADTRYGDHYDPQEMRLLDADTEASLLVALRSALLQTGGHA